MSIVKSYQMTEEDQQESFVQIKRFVELHKLTDDVGNIRFDAEVIYNTVSCSGTQYESKIGIEFNSYDGFGQLEIFAKEIDSNVFPTTFSAFFQSYTIDDDGNLCITGYHNLKPHIGRYVVVVRVINSRATII